MNTRDEEYMLMLDQCRSITQAADKLHVSQPALSMFLSKLEAGLNMVLFERIGKRLVPTQAGKTYLKYARQIITSKSDFQMEALELKKEHTGELHVGCLNKRALLLMPGLIRRFRGDHPGIDVHLYTYHPERLCEMVLNGELDLIYLNRAYSRPELNSRLVRKDHLLLVLPENHPAARNAVRMDGIAFPYLDLNHVKNEIFYVLEKGYSLRDLVDEAIRYSRIQPSAMRTVRLIDLGCQMAAEGLGVSFTTEAYIQNLAYTTPRMYFRTGDIQAEVSWNLIWRKSSVLPQYMKNFMILLKQMETEPAGTPGADGGF